MWTPRNKHGYIDALVAGDSWDVPGETRQRHGGPPPMVERASDRGSVSLDRYPAPACGYHLDGDEARVHAVNEPFESQFGPVADGTTVSTALAEAGLESRDDGSLAASLEDGEAFVVDASAGDGRTYVAQAVPPDDDSVGHVLFVDRGEQSPPDGPRELGVDHVASVVSHDLRNPLDVAKARLEAGRDLGDDEHFEHVARAHDRMERIIQDVLTLARGEDVIDPDDAVDLGELAESAWETVETNGARLVVEESLPTAAADPDRVSRLFENLFRNAVEHGATSPDAAADESVSTVADGDGHGTAGRRERHAVTVSVGRLGGGGFYVEDDGPGIPPAERDRVFEPGYTAADRGTGFGLAIVARIADVHGWSIDVTDAATGGARFEITDIE